MKYLTICPKAVAVQWVLFQVRNSKHMEPEGLRRCLPKMIDDSDIDMHTLATDRHLMVGKLMKDHHPHVSKLLSSMLWKIIVIILYSYGWLNRVHPATHYKVLSVIYQNWVLCFFTSGTQYEGRIFVGYLLQFIDDVICKRDKKCTETRMVSPFCSHCNS